MKFIEYYIAFCSKFSGYKFPKLRFRELNDRFHNLYRILYKIDANDVEKASFVVFVSSFFTSIIISLLISNLSLLIIILYSVIFSTIISYKFGSVLYKDLIKNESLLNSILYFIKIDFSLIQKTNRENTDNCLRFIELLKAYQIPISNYFKTIFKKIHEGRNPETQLSTLITPSNDFDNYVKNLLINNFKTNDYYIEDDSSLEKQFKIYLRQIQSKISILFFIGLFFPIGICFLILFQLINIIFIILIIPIFIGSINLFFKKFIKTQSYLIGLINDFSSHERQKYEEFLLFLKGFASYLKNNVSPEKAILKSFNQNKKLLNILDKPLRIQISHLMNFSYSFNEMLEALKSELKSLRYVLILDALKNYTQRSAYYTSDKIIEILEIINKHQKLEGKLEVIMKGEKFKIFFFIFLLPIITGAISGMFPLFNIVMRNLTLVGNEFLLFFENPLNSFNMGIVIAFLISSITTVSNYFLKIICQIRRIPIILISNFIFVLTFFISFLNISNFL